MAEEQKPVLKGAQPYIYSKGDCGEHIKWLETVMGAKLEQSWPSNKPEHAGKIFHAALVINDGPVYLGDRLGLFGAPAAEAPTAAETQCFVLYKTPEEVQAVWDKAVANGATVRMELEQTFWGVLYGVMTDPYEGTWAVSAPVPNPAEGAEEPADKKQKAEKLEK